MTDCKLFKNNTALFISPHPDDETLGCGGTILKLKACGCKIYLLIVTRGYEKYGDSKQVIDNMKNQTSQAIKEYGFDDSIQLDFPTTFLDTIPIKELINAFGEIIKRWKPNILFIPNRSDVHTDHRIVFDAIWSCTRSFRFPIIQEVCSYETVSETEFSPPLSDRTFIPNTFCDISDYLEKKLEIMDIYSSEIANHPFPRSRKNLEALATFRGATIGVKYAEAFVSLKRIF